jgi:hypothetical protein
MVTPSNYDYDGAPEECWDYYYDEFAEDYRRQLKKKNKVDEDEFWDEEEVVDPDDYLDVYMCEWKFLHYYNVKFYNREHVYM